MEIIRSGATRRMSNVVQHGHTIYLAGQVADDTTADAAGQMREVLGKIEKLLTAHGSSKAHILFCQIYLSDIRFFADMNEVWDAWVVAGAEPARATVEARLAHTSKYVEMCVVAAVAEQ